MSKCKPKLFDRDSFSVKRFSGSDYDEDTGLPVENELATFVGKGAIQPLTGRELLQLEEGDRKKRHMWLWTFTEIILEDVIEFEAESFEVRSVEKWDDLEFAPYFKARMVLRDVQP